MYSVNEHNTIQIVLVYLRVCKQNEDDGSVRLHERIGAPRHTKKVKTI